MEAKKNATKLGPVVGRAVGLASSPGHKSKSVSSLRDVVQTGRRLVAEAASSSSSASSSSPSSSTSSHPASVAGIETTQASRLTLKQNLHADLPAAGAGGRSGVDLAAGSYVSPIGVDWLRESNAALCAHTECSTRPLTAAEIAALKSNGNRVVTAGGWDLVRVRNEPGGVFDPNAVQRCTFSGSIHLGCFSGAVAIAPGVLMPCGVFDSSLSNVSISKQALVASTTLLHNAYVLEGAALVGCGIVSCTGPTTFANGMELPLGLEGKGRLTKVYASMTVAEAAAGATHSHNETEFLAFISGVSEAVRNDRCVFGRHSRVLHCARVTDVLLCGHARLENSVVERATVLSSETDRTVVEGGSVVRDALLQWGAHVDSMGCVDHAVLCEHAHVDRHGKLLESFLGPQSGVSEGEVSASLVGPMVGFHHQALLIAALWPEGKGNVGYGANVGSNHTSKAPDQEIRPGEGVFFGLGTCVKFPSNYQGSPYSVIATGVCALPQKMDFPFALVNTPGEVIAGLSPAINEVTPAWVLSDSVYTVWRNQHKFQARNTSKRHTMETDVFRPEIVDKMIDARARLMNPKGEPRLRTAKGDGVYTDRQIAGLGKNYMTEASRKKAIATYTRYIQMYALGTLSNGLASDGIRVDLCTSDLVSSPLLPILAGPSSGAKGTSHGAAVLAAEFPDVADIPALVSKYRDMLIEEVALAKKAKSKDSIRGSKVIPDYNDVHPSADRDKIVLWLKDMAVAQMKPKL